MVATDGVPPARLARAFSMQRRRQLSQGKQALNGAGTPAFVVLPRWSWLSMGMYAVDTADAAELGELRDAARGGRAAATLRRRQLSQGKQALNGAGAPPAAENLQANGAEAAPAANGQGAPNGTQGAQEETAVPTDAVAAAHFGRSVSMERRRQLSQGKQALKGAGALNGAVDVQANGASAPPAANGQGAPNGQTAAPTDAVAAAHFGRSVSMERRRQLSQGKQAIKGAGGLPPAENRQVDRAPAPPADGQGASNGQTAAPTDAVTAAHLGRSLSMQRRRQLSQGKQALNGAGAPPAPQDRQAEASRRGQRSRRAERQDGRPDRRPHRRPARPRPLHAAPPPAVPGQAGPDRRRPAARRAERARRRRRRRRLGS